MASITNDDRLHSKFKMKQLNAPESSAISAKQYCNTLPPASPLKSNMKAQRKTTVTMGNGLSEVFSLDIEFIM
jgi:hypothetical protein